MDTENGGASPEAFERLNAEIARLRASRERLVLAADADRRLLERELHQGVQQRLVALAVALQLAEEALSLDGATAATRLRDAGRELERALDDATRLAERIHPPLLDAGGLAAALRTAATRAGIPRRSTSPPTARRRSRRPSIGAVSRPSKRPGPAGGQR